MLGTRTCICTTFQRRWSCSYVQQKTHGPHHSPEDQFVTAKTIVLFVSLGFNFQLENFSLIWRRHLCRWRAANFDLWSALMAIEQWGFLSESHLLWQGSSVYNGHLRGACKANALYHCTTPVVKFIWNFD